MTKNKNLNNLRLKIFIQDLKSLNWYNWLFIILTILTLIAAALSPTEYDASAERPAHFDKVKDYKY